MVAVGARPDMIARLVKYINTSFSSHERGTLDKNRVFLQPNLKDKRQLTPS